MGSKVNVGAILIVSRQPEALARFYQQAFGFDDPVSDGANHLGLVAGNTYLGFDRCASPAPQARDHISLWFSVEDVPAVYARLLELGATPREAPDAVCSPGETLATVHDPEGNVVGLVGPAGAPSGGDPGPGPSPR